MTDIARDDYSGPVATTTFGTIARHLEENRLLRHGAVLAEDGSTRQLL